MFCNALKDSSMSHRARYSLEKSRIVFLRVYAQCFICFRKAFLLGLSVGGLIWGAALEEEGQKCPYYAVY